MACCLTAPSHNLNQCWLIISKVWWHSSEAIPQPPFTKFSLKITYLKLNWNLPGANELTHWPLGNVAAISHFQTLIKDRYLEHFMWNCPWVNATNLTDDWSTLVQGHQAITWTNVDQVLWCPKTLLDHNKLKHRSGIDLTKAKTPHSSPAWASYGNLDCFVRVYTSYW